MISRIYIASPFFNDKEREAVSIAERILRERGFQVFSPREHNIIDEESGTRAWSKKTFQIDCGGIDWADCVVVLYWGNYSDTGTAWECGYAFAIKKPVVVVQLGESSNLMVHEGSHTNISGTAALETYDFDSMPIYEYFGKMF